MHYVIHDASLIIIQDTYVGERVIKTRPWNLDPGHSSMQLWEKKNESQFITKNKTSMHDISSVDSNISIWGGRVT